MLFERLLSISKAVTPAVATKQLYVWGRGALGQLDGNDETLVDKSSPVQISAGPSWQQISMGLNHTLGITTTGALWAWGGNDFGQLGLGSGYSAPVIIPQSTVTGSISWTKIAFGGTHSLGITSDGRLWGWGLNTSGQVGVNNLTNVSVPTLVSGPAATSWTTITAGLTHSLAITTTGQLYAWGLTTGGQLGIGSLSAAQSSPVLVNAAPLETTNSSWRALALGDSHALGIKDDYSLWAWGGNGVGQLGLGDIINRVYPFKVGSSSWTAVAAGGGGSGFSFGITTDGRLFAWGSGINGALGDGTTVAKSSPILVSGPASTSWSIVAAGVATAYAITTTGRIYAWGNGAAGALGDSSLVVGKSTPVLVSGPAATSWAAIAAGGSFAAAITTTGQLYAWGLGTSGQLGDSTIVSKSSPVLVSGPAATSWSAIAAGTTAAYAITTTGQLYAWGVGTAGALGDLTITSKSSPVLVSGPASTSWAAVAAFGSGGVAITSIGRLYAWGLGTSGQIGDSSIASKSSPVLVSGPAATSWTIITGSRSGAFAAAIPSASPNNLYVWGLNTTGQLGIGTLTSVSSPVVVTATVPGTYSWTAVSGGATHTLAIDTNGRLYAWGSGTSGTLGDLTSTTKAVPVLVSGPATTSWSIVTAGSNLSVAITTLGQLYAWGLGTSGQLGDSSITSKSSPVLVSGPAATSWSTVSAGPNFCLAITTVGRLYAWGGGSGGQLGDLSITSKSSPVLVSGPASTSWSTVSAGELNGLAATTTGQLYAWGTGSSAQLGTNTSSAQFSSPVLVSGPASTSWSIVSAGITHSGAITSGGKLYGWGLNTSYQVASVVVSPIQVGSSSWTSVSAGGSHSLGITTDGRPFAWGFGTSGQLGDATIVSKSSPVLVSGPAATSWAALHAGSNFSLGITTLGALYSWGTNTNGILGIATTQAGSSSPVVVSNPVEPTASSWTVLATGSTHSLGIKADGSLWAWGTNFFGSLGDGTTANRVFPVKIGNSSWTIVAAGANQSLGITTAGRLFAWGSGSSGGLGDLTTVSKSSPVLVSGPAATSWSTVSIGTSFCLAITTTGQLYAWGLGTNGQLGDLTITTKSSPVLVSGPASTSWSTVSSGSSYSLAITTTGQLYAWGLGTSGQLGDSSITSKSSPVLVSGPASTSWSFASAGSTHGAAITTLGVLYAWGGNPAGQLGDLTIAPKSSPVLVSGPASTSWSTVTAKSNYTVAITTTGQLYAWGTGSAGQLGDNSITGKSSPVLVSGPAATSWSILGQGSGASHGFAATTTNLLYGWGLNTSSQVGVGTFTNISSPVAVLATDTATYSWTAAAAGTFPLAISTAGRLYSWGSNLYGELGDLSQVGKYAPNLVSGPTTTSWSVISAGANFGFAISSAGRLYAWGVDAGYGNLGNLDFGVSVSSPVLVSGPATTSWSAVAASKDPDFLLNGYAITTTGRLYAWGYNGVGQLGDTTTIGKSSPILVSGPATTSWTAVTAGAQAAAAITT